MGPCPLPGGKLVFTSNRDGFRPPKGYPVIALQLFVMDDDGTNIEKIGHLNIAGALHPVVLKDGRIMFSSLESQGIRSDISWGIWTIHPDGTNWNPLVSAFDPGGASNGFHFQTQLSDGNRHRRGVLQPEQQRLRGVHQAAADAAGRLPGVRPGLDERSAESALAVRPLRQRQAARTTACRSCPAARSRSRRSRSIRKAPPIPRSSATRIRPRVGKFTHPSGAPDNHLLTIYSPGPVNHQYTFLPQLDGGIYLIKDGQVDRAAGRDAADQERSELQRVVAAGRRALRADLRREGAAAAQAAGQRRLALAAPAGGHAVWPRRHVELLQARELSQRPRSPRAR